MTSATASPIVPVILSGGAGTRLWPLSRETAPKPVMPVPDGETLLGKTVARALEASGLDPCCLKLELTESVLMRDVETTLVILKQLNDMGVRLSIDDFGTGYSSFNYLRRFPLHTLKIDRSFVRDIPGHQDVAAITRAIIAMGHSLKFNVVAEGVETHPQLEYLRELGCDEYQGYLFSAAVPADQFGVLLQREHEDRAPKRAWG